MATARAPSKAMATAEDERLAKEIEMLSNDLTDDLHKYLDEISTTGHFAAFKKFDKFVDPQVRLIGADGTPEHDILIPLSPRDALKLIEAAQLAPPALMLASRHEYDEESSDDEFHAIINVTEESLKLTTVFDTDGDVIFTDLVIDDEDILPWEAYEDREPDGHEYDGYEESSTHWYRDMVLFLVPNEYIAAKRLRTAPWSPGEPLRKSLRRICLIVSDNRGQTTYSGASDFKHLDSTVSEVITICTEFGMTDLLLDLTYAFRHSLSANALESLRDLKHKMDWKLPEDRSYLETIFGRVVLGYKSLSEKYDTLSNLIGAEPSDLKDQEDCIPELKDWVIQILAMMFSGQDPLTSEDLSVLVRIAASDTSGLLLRDRVIPKIEQQMQDKDSGKTVFMIALLSRMFESPKLLTESSLAICKPLIRMMGTNLSFRKSQRSLPWPSSMYGTYGANNVQQVARKPALVGQVLGNVLGHIMDLHFYDYGQLLIHSMEEQATSIDPPDYEYMIIPFLKFIIMRLLDGKDALGTYKNLFQACLSLYISRFVGKEPVQINWSRNPVRCNCRDCTDLNAFLRSPVDSVREIRIPRQRRDHLHAQLDGYTDCTYVLDGGYNETMVVGKGGRSFQDNLVTWSSKTESASAALRSLEDQEDTSNSPSQLRKLLGDKYDEIMTLRTARVMTAAQQQPTRTTESTRPMHTVATSSSASNAAIVGVPNPPATRSEIPQVVGQKRKAVVIDLSDN